VVGDLLTFPERNEFYWRLVGPDLAGKTFQEALVLLKRTNDCLAIAIATDGEGYVTNPPADERLREGDRLLVIPRTSDEEAEPLAT
jgi:Trk K+ transport system NAD-binding subunit